ncbi:MAG: CcmD family protein [bacterium]
MPSDATTFFAAFGAIALAIAAYLWHLERRGHRIEERLRTLEADAANAKTGGADPGRKA